jgi:hypothetical protein
MIERDFAWLNEHSPDLVREYAGKWVAVAEGRVVGVGDTATEAAEQARNEIPEGDFVLERVNADADVIYDYS